MKRRPLPVFDFGGGVQYDNIVSDNRSSMDCLEMDPRFVDNQYLSSPPPVHTRFEYDTKLKYQKPQKKHNKYINNDKYINNNKYINKPQIKKERPQRINAPLLNEIFGNCQLHEQYLKFDENVRHQYSEKLKTSAKREKNPKNYFLLAILRNFDYEIGTKIGARHYGFICDSTLNKGPLKGRDSNKYHGVDFETEKKTEKENKIEREEKNPISILQQVMDCMRLKQGIDYALSENYGGNHIQRAQFQFKFRLHNSDLAFGFSNTKKQDAKKGCAHNALNILRNDANYAEVISRKEAGIKGSGKKDAAPQGYEYPVFLAQRYRNTYGRSKYLYDAMSVDNKNKIYLQKKNGYDRNVTEHRLEIFTDRGYFINNQIDNPNVEQLYAQKWSFFQGDHNIPKHSHPYLHDNGEFIKQLKDSNERKLWKAIWRFYKNKNKHFSHKNNLKHVQQQQSFDNKSTSNSLLSTCSENVLNDANNNNNKLQCSHFLIYDFDGTVYAQRLYRDSKMQNNEYLSELNIQQIRQIGWKLKRIDAIKNHFNTLIKYKPNLGIVLHSFHKRETLNKVFNAINVNISNYFDIIICHGHNILNHVNASKNGRKYSKNMMIEILCKQYNVLTNNTLYVDDDPNINHDVKCCEVFVTKKRNGISKREMNQIESKIVYQYKLVGGDSQHQPYQQQNPH